MTSHKHRLLPLLLSNCADAFFLLSFLVAAALPLVIFAGVFFKLNIFLAGPCNAIKCSQYF